jgi:hypothetical protein
VQNTIVYLIGYFGIGKYSIAKALAELEPCKIVDNHHVLNPIFSLLEQDGITPLPPLIWHQAAKVREAVLETIRFLSPPNWNFIFTNDLSEDSGSHKLFDDVANVAEARAARLVPVLLRCELDEYLRRVVRPERRERLKGINPAEARERHQQGQAFVTDHPNQLVLDITRLSPEAAARAILGFVDKLVEK